jgi:prephenate dehydrogenase
VKNTERVTAILDWLKELSLEVIEMTPEEHDKQAAYTHAFAFLIGKIGMKMDVRKNQISTKGFEAGVLYNQEAVESDTPELFNDMHNYNKYGGEMRENVGKALSKIEEELSRE